MARLVRAVGGEVGKGVLSLDAPTSVSTATGAASGGAGAGAGFCPQPDELELAGLRFTPLIGGGTVVVFAIQYVAHMWEHTN